MENETVEKTVKNNYFVDNKAKKLANLTKKNMREHYINLSEDGKI